MSDDQTAEAPPQPPRLIPPVHPGLRLAALTLYLPVIGALAYLIGICGLILAHGKTAGLYGVPYGLVLALLLRRYGRIWRGQATGVWKDFVAMAAADVLLLILWLERFSY